MQRLFESAHLKSRFGDTVSDFERLAMIRFPLILLIVFFHNDRGAEFSSRLQGSPAMAGVVEFLAHGLGGIRVPTFFLIAGFIFFRAGRPTAAWFRAKFNARARSLLVPLVLWNVLGLTTLALAQQLPFMTSVLDLKGAGNGRVLDFTTMQFIASILGTPDAQPFVYPLWFLRDLFVLVLLTPAIHWSIRASNGWVMWAVLLIWALHVDPYLVAEDAFFFFFVGCWLAIGQRSLFTLDVLGPVAALGWLALQAADPSVASEPEAYKLKAACGVVGVLYLSGWLAQWPATSTWIRKTARYSFFIFVAHEPLLTVVRKAYLKAAAPSTDAQLFAAYFAIVFFVIVVLVYVFRFAEQHLPRLLNVMTGGRSA